MITQPIFIPTARRSEDASHEVMMIAAKTASSLFPSSAFCSSPLLCTHSSHGTSLTLGGEHLQLYIIGNSATTTMLRRVSRAIHAGRSSCTVAMFVCAQQQCPNRRCCGSSSPGSDSHQAVSLSREDRRRRRRLDISATRLTLFQMPGASTLPRTTRWTNHCDR